MIAHLLLLFQGTRWHPRGHLSLCDYISWGRCAYPLWLHGVFS